MVGNNHACHLPVRTPHLPISRQPLPVAELGGPPHTSPVRRATTTEPDTQLTATDTDKRQPANDPMADTHRGQITTNPAAVVAAGA